MADKQTQNHDNNTRDIGPSAINIKYNNIK